MGTGGDIWALVPAAGSGRRLGADRPKQYLPLQEYPVLVHTLRRLATHPRVRGVMVGLAEEDAWWPTIEPLLAGLPAPVYTFVGGAERAHTVLNGLHSLSAEAAAGAHALVHDAARPCVRHTDIDRLIDEVGQASDGGILGVPVSDTVKKVDSAGVILETVDRAALWRALTPQYFRIDRLQAALEAAIAAGYIVTDEASAMEFAGYHPRVVEGAGDNIKITYDADLALAALYLDRQRETGKR